MAEILPTRRTTLSSQSITRDLIIGIHNIASFAYRGAGLLFLNIYLVKSMNYKSIYYSNLLNLQNIYKTYIFDVASVTKTYVASVTFLPIRRTTLYNQSINLNFENFRSSYQYTTTLTYFQSGLASGSG